VVAIVTLAKDPNNSKIIPRYATVAIVLLAKDIPTINNNPTIKQSKTNGCARLNIMPPTNNFEPQPF
jgi:hypothetical protein